MIKVKSGRQNEGHEVRVAVMVVLLESCGGQRPASPTQNNLSRSDGDPSEIVSRFKVTVEGIIRLDRGGGWLLHVVCHT